MIPRYHRYRAGRRWLVALGLLASAVFHCALIARFLLSPEQFRARTRLLLQRQFQGDVHLGEAAYEFPAGFRLKDLLICRPAERGGGELFRTKALAVDLGFLALLRGKVKVDDLLLDEPEVNLTQADLAAMKQPRPEGPGEPLGRIVVRGGRIVLGKDVLFAGSPERELRDVHIELRQEGRLSPGYNFEGEASSALWGRCKLEGILDLGGRRLDAKVAAHGIAIGAKLREAVPEQYRSYTKALDAYALAGMVDLSLDANVSWADKGSIALSAAVDLRDCSAAWERFPVRVTDIHGRIVYDGTNIYYQDIRGRAGPATVTLSGQTTREKVDVHLMARGRPLDREVYEAAPQKHKDLWDRCGIEGGVISVDHQSTWWRADKRFEATIRSDVRDVRATYKAFPYPLTDVAGSVRWENGVSYIEGLRGRRGNARVQIHGQVTDAGVPDLTVEASDVPFDDALRKALSPGWQKTYDELHPEGTAAVHCTVTNPGGSPGKFQYRLVIRPEGAAFQHKDFPHKFTDVRGDILVDEAGTVSFRELRGRLGAIPLQFLGTVRPGEKGSVLDLTVVAPEVELGPAARAILPKDWTAVYDDLDPRGKVSFTWRMATDPATGAQRRSCEVACVQDCSIQHRLFPVRVTGLMGRFSVDETGRATFTGMKGRIGNAVVEAVAGEVSPADGRMPDADGRPPDADGRMPDADGRPPTASRLRFTIRASGLALNEEIRKAVPAAWQKVWDEVRPTGEAAIEYQFTGNPQKPDQPAQRVSIEPSDAAFCFRRLALPVSDVTRGKVVFDHDGNATISNVQGKVRGKTVQLGGKVVAAAGGNVLHLDVAADELTLDDELRKVLPPEWQEVWDSLGPGGRIAATASCAIHIQKEEWQSFHLDATLRGCEATWRKVPVRLTGLRGRFEYADGVATLSDVLGECAIAEQVRLSGRIATKGAGTDRLQVTVQNARIVPQLLGALPDDLRKAIEAIELKGAADAELTFAGPEKGDGPTQCFGLLRLRDASFRHTHTFEQVSGNLRIDKGSIHPDGTQAFEGGLDLRKAVVRKLVLTEIKGALAYNRAREGGAKALSSRLALNDLSGTFYGGNLSAKVSLDLGGSGALASWLSLRGADFKAFSREALGSDSPATGTLNLRIELPPGRYKGEKDLIGDGEADISRADLGQLPIAAALFNTLSLRSPLDRSITEANARFGITKDQLVIKELHLLGEARVLAGQGTIGFDGTLNLRLISPRAERSILDVVLLPLNVIREQLVQVDVRGTVSQPEFRVVATPAIPELLDQFIGALGIWRKRHPEKPSTPEAPKQP